MKKVQQFLDYASTHPDAIITYHTSDMVLVGHSDASYLSKSKAHSRADGHFFMSNNTAKLLNNGSILTIAQIIKLVVSLAAEAEVGALYISCREAIPACYTLEFMGHPQPPTPMQTNNTTSLGIPCQQQRYQEIGINGHEILLAPQQRMLRTISTLLGPQQKELRQLRDKASCRNSSPINAPSFPHKYLYLTSTTPTTHRQSSCSKVVLDIYCTTVWHNLHTYSKSHHESLRPPVCTGTDRDQQSHHISLSQESSPRTGMYDTIAHKLVTTFTSSSMCEAILSNCHLLPH
jgi:hypothetical protein